MRRVVEELLQLFTYIVHASAYGSSPPYKNILGTIITIAIMRVSNLVVAIVLLVVLVTTADSAQNVLALPRVEVKGNDPPDP